MKYLDHETNLRRIKLEKEIALADAEEEAIKLVMNDEVKNGLARKDAKSDERFEESFREGKFIVGKIVTKHEPSLLRPEALAYEVDTGRCSNRSFVLNSQTKEEINPFAVRRLFERDFSEESTSGSGLSKEDRRFLVIAREGITQLENGYYELPLPMRIRMLFFLTTVSLPLVACYNSREDSWPTEDTVTTMSPSWRL